MGVGLFVFFASSGKSLLVLLFWVQSLYLKGLSEAERQKKVSKDQDEALLQAYDAFLKKKEEAHLVERLK